MSRSRKDGHGGHRRFWWCGCLRCENNRLGTAKYGSNKRAAQERAIEEQDRETEEEK